MSPRIDEATWLSRPRREQFRALYAVVEGSGLPLPEIAIRFLLSEPRIVILDEPTRGIDVGTKREMYFLIEELARSGLAIVVISSELPEIVGLSHRVVVMRSGRITGVLDGDAIDEHEIVQYATGLKQQGDRHDHAA